VKRREFFGVLSGAALLSSMSAFAQQSKKSTELVFCGTEQTLNKKQSIWQRCDKA